MGKNLQTDMYSLTMKLTKEKELDSLLAMILEEAMSICQADYGIMYIHDVDVLYYHSLISKSEKKQLHVYNGDLNENPIVLTKDNPHGKAALELKPQFSKDSIIIPLLDDEDECVSVMELTRPVDVNGDRTSFTEEDIDGVEALSALAGILFDNKRLAHEKGELLHSFVSVMVGAVDKRSPYNANHTKNMVKYAEKFLTWIDENGVSLFRRKDNDAFLMSVWLHDIGKLLIPLEIMDKSTRLGLDLKNVEHRISIGILMEKLCGTPEKVIELEIARGFVEEINDVDFLSSEFEKKLLELVGIECMDEDGHIIPLLTNEEMDSLNIKRGTLTENERHMVQDHVIYTRFMLEGMNFKGRYKDIPKIAGDHHEFLDGSGYPNKLKGKEIRKETRLLTILDIYDALTAEDRPYKDPMSPGKAFKILYDMATEGKLDEEILELFESSGAWKNEN